MKLVHVMQFTGQRGRQIEPETIHVHFLDPVAQTVHDQLQRIWQIYRQCVAGAGVIHVIARVFRRKTIVNGVVQAAKTERGPKVIAFGCVVVNHVENHFDARGVKIPDHRLEFSDLFPQTP